MDPVKMLARAKRDQWSVTDLDWTRPPRPMSEQDERAVVQFFTDMAGIERLAAALFREQSRRVDDPVLEELFGICVRDELRHAHVAQLLADYYDVHRYQRYAMNEALVRFTPHFVHMVSRVSPDVANAYITTGELVLDIALLRSIDDFVDDEMSHEAMELINRDESRHIAVDFHMVEYYVSDEYQAVLESAPKPSARDRAQATWAFTNVLRHASPFFRDVFFGAMDTTDPTGRRLKQAFKRIQLVTAKRGVDRRPFVRFMLTLQSLHNHKLVGPALGGVLARVMGIQPRVIEVLYTEAEMAATERMTFDEMAEEAVGAKYATA